MLDVRRLRALRELADRGTVAAAADALHLTPSAVSQQLAALEREVGGSLVEPDGRRVRLTPAAHVLLRHADAVFAQLERMDADLAAHATEPVGDVRVGAFATAVRGLVAPAGGLLAGRAPGLSLAVTEMEAPEAFLALARRELDVVVSMEGPDAPAADDPRVARRALLRDSYDAALPVGHPLAGRAAVRLADLADETWIGPPEGWLCESVLLGGCRAAGFTPRVRHRSGDWVSTLVLVAGGFGVTLVPRLSDCAAPQGAVLRPLAGATPTRHVFAACRRGAQDGPAIGPVLEALADAASAHHARIGALAAA